MSERKDIVIRLRLRPTILRKNRFGDMDTDRAATALFNDCHALMCEAAGEIERLRVERDEARQRLCKVVGDNRDMWGEDVAKEYGWDCFKEEK